MSGRGETMGDSGREEGRGVKVGVLMEGWFKGTGGGCLKYTWNYLFLKIVGCR